MQLRLSVLWPRVWQYIISSCIIANALCKILCCTETCTSCRYFTHCFCSKATLAVSTTAITMRTKYVNIYSQLFTLNMAACANIVFAHWNNMPGCRGLSHFKMMHIKLFKMIFIAVRYTFMYILYLYVCQNMNMFLNNYNNDLFISWTHSIVCVVNEVPEMGAKSIRAGSIMIIWLDGIRIIKVFANQFLCAADIVPFIFNLSCY